MDALLPSEKARLVLGYLQEEKCDELAKMFLETSPHLQECRLVAQRGGRYSTKVGGLNLSDILDKYCAVNAIVQEKLSKVSDSEQMKNCNDITEQLSYLLEGSRGHRFVVNINVPTQNSPNGSFGTPTLSTSSRKRQHSGSDRGKRVAKSLNNLMEKDSQTPVGLNCDTVEATPLESLPGHKPSAKKLRVENHINNLINKSPNKSDSTQNAAKESRSNEFTSVGTQSDLNIVQNTQKHQSTETALTSNSVQSPSKSTEGTSTEQPMNYCSTEVQTVPLDLFDADYDLEPIEGSSASNVQDPQQVTSILTDELIHRTELAQQIAENINKSLINIQENSHENLEANLSHLLGFDSAVKTAVESSDKVIEALFNEMFMVADTDSNQGQGMNDRVYHENVEPMDVENNTEFINTPSGQHPKRPEVPLKQRLRSSSRSHINPDEDDRDCIDLLENQNEEAIRSIVANVMAIKQGPTPEDAPQPENSSSNDAQRSEYILPDEPPSTDNENVEPNKNANNAKATKPRKNPRKPRTPKQKGIKIEAKAEEIKLQEQNIVTMPTLILCSQNDMQTNPVPVPLVFDGYRPIAPKPLPIEPKPDRPPDDTAAPKIFLRTVHVPRHLVKTTQLEASAQASQLIRQLQASPQKTLSVASASCSGSPIVVIADDKQRRQQQQQKGAGDATITLYGDDSNSEVRVAAPVASMPVISLDESTSQLAAGTGLSPFFKGNDAEEASSEAQPKIVVRKKDETTRRESDDKKNDKMEKKLERDEKDKKAKTSKTTNPTIVVTAPDEGEVVSTEKEKELTKKDVTEKKVEEKSNDVNREKKKSADVTKEKTKLEDVNKEKAKPVDVNKEKAKPVDVNKEKTKPDDVIKEKTKPADVNEEKATLNVKDSKVDDKTKSESKVNKKSIDVEKEKKIDDKKDKKPEEKPISSKKENKVEEKLAPAKKPVSPRKDAVSEDKPVPVKKDTVPQDKSIPVKKDSVPQETPVPTKKDTAPQEKPVPAKKDVPENNPVIAKNEEKSVNEAKAKNNARIADIIITKRTPKSLLKDRSRNNRLSLSTPRRRNSHVRALDFDEKTPEHDASARKVPQSCTRPKSSAVQGLFQSPPFSGETVTPVTLVPEPRPVRTHVSVPPIATRSPAPKLQGNWNKVAGIGMILGDSSESSPEKSQTETPPPKSWDSDLRKIVGDTNEDEDKSRPKSAKKSRRRNSIKGKGTPTQQEQLKITPPPATLKPKIGVPAKTSPEILARIRELQTPAKFDGLTIPPTPRVTFATPGGVCLAKVPSGKVVSIKDGVDTPDFPPTPQIVFTPKIVEEEAHEKKPSPYYEPSEEVVGEKVVVQQTTVAIQRKNVVELQESKTVEITRFGVIEENMVRKEDTTSEDNSKEIIEEESMGETNASADTTNTDSDSDSDSDSNSSTSSSSSNSSSSNSSSCSSNASSPMKSVNVSHHDNSTTESEVDSPQKVANSREELERVAESSPKKETPPPKVVVDTTPAVVAQLTSTISAIITNEKPKKSPAKPKIINVQRIAPPTSGISEQLTRAAKLSLQLEEKRQRVMAKFKQTATNTKRTVTVRRVTAVKKPEVVKQESVKKAKPSPKKKALEEVKPKEETQKAKVEQVKRDLFAPGDVEADQQRTTRSQAARKSVDENPPLPGVLECLQLIPANKSGADEQLLLDQSVEGLSNSATNSLEVSFVYDDSVPIKKRKRNYSSSELENEYAFTFPDEDEVRVMRLQPEVEMLKLAPKPVKKKSPKKSPVKAKRKIAKSLPLAASSPLKKRKAVKRKASPVKEEKQVEKKPKVEAKASLDPAAMLKSIDLDKFLKKVHK